MLMSVKKARVLWVRALSILLAIMLMGGISGFSGIATAATVNGQTNFSRIYNIQAKGNIKITGNTLMMPSVDIHGASVVNAAMNNPTAMNNSYFMSPIDLDGSPETTTSSTSVNITINPGATVEKAFLIWGASTIAGSGYRKADGTMANGQNASDAVVSQGFPIKFKTPKTPNYTTIRPVQVSRFTNYKKDYTAYADVTELVKAGGQGTYWAGDVALSTGLDTYAGWSLVVVYKDDSKPKNDMSVFFGHQTVSGSAVSISLTGLVTPPSGPVHAKVGTVTWEGDGYYSGDYMTVGETPAEKNPRVSDNGSPSTNFFNSRVTDEGNQQTDRNPNFLNNMGIDAKVINIDGVLKNKQDKLGFYLGTSGDVYYPTVLTTEIEQYAPDVKANKTVKNLTTPDGLAKEGDILEYTLDMKNIGYDTATLTVATDTLPEGVDYIPGSIVHMENGSPVKRTDAKGDDDSEYLSDTRNIQLHVGNKATASTGGNLDYNQQTIYKYQAKVNAKGVGSPIVNKVEVNYAGSDGKASSGGTASSTSNMKTETAKPSFDFTKTSNKDSNYRLNVGDEIEYTFTVVNTGNVSLSDLKISDALANLGPITTTPADKTVIAPNETVTAKATYRVTQEDVDRGTLVNNATASVKDGQGTPLSKQATTTLTADRSPDMVFTKTVNNPPAEEMAVGKELTYTFTVKNTGNVTLNNLRIEDPHPGIASVAITPTTLTPGQTATGTAKYTVTQDDMNRGSILNTASAKAAPPDGKEISRISTAEAPIKRIRDFTFTKTTDKDATYKLKKGDTVKYTFTVTNTGNVTLRNLVVDDPLFVGKTITMNPQDIDPGKSAQGTMDYVVTQEDVDRGVLKNTAKASFTTASGSKIEKTDTVTLVGDQKPAITFKKTSDKPENAKLQLGDVITYTFSLTNDGNVTLNNLALNDPMPGMPTKFDVTELAPSKSTSVSAKHTVTQEDVDRGYVENTATASGTDTNGKKLEASDTVHLDVPQAPRIELDKKFTPADKTNYKLGEEVTYVFTVTNTGNVTLHDVALEDPMLGGTVALPVNTLAPGASTTATAKYAVTQADLDNGRINNTAMVTSRGPQGGMHYNMGSAKVVLDREPAMSFTKANDRPDGYKLTVGDEITYTFTVANTGNVTLHDVTVTDPLPGVGAITMSPTEIAPGKSAVGTAKYTVKQADVDRGELINTASAVVKDPVDTSHSAMATNKLTAEQNPGMDFEKSTTKKSGETFTLGEKIPYTFVIRNTGNVTLSLVRVDDPLPGMENVELDRSELAPGQEARGTAEYTVTQADIDAGTLVNKAVANALPPKGTAVSHSSSVKLEIPRKPAISLEKTTDKPAGYQYRPGDLITYTFKVTNTGNVTLSDLTVKDPLDGLSAIKLNKTSIVPGDTATGTATYTITTKDMDRGSLKNEATATGTAPDGQKPSAVSGVTLSAKQEPALAIEKASTQPAGYKLKAGDLITYTFKVVNTGNVTISNVAVQDPLEGINIQERADVILGPGEETTFDAIYVVKQKDVDAGKLDNQATAHGKSPANTDVSAQSNTVSIPSEHKPGLSLVKSADKSVLVAGETITYSFEVTNTGNVTVSDV
ncbi:hypothetical protein, partial [Trueperella sp. LYQ143]|uniref:DUF7507 domain-containing protein n=1 Tax=Trueperella sp. LYQ143 TaxID=3391059 RepID=UPI003983D5C4